MKRNIFLSTSFFLLLAFSLLLPSCSEDLPENTPVSPGQSLRIRVDDSGFTATSQTRAQETAYQTVFTAGDQIGVFAVKNGTIKEGVTNICLTASTNADGNLVWLSDDGLNLHPDATYYAYYPWQEHLSGDPVPSAGNAAAFFANVITKWTPANDQSDYAKYTAQDLMIAKGSLSDKSLTFSMAHQMSLVVIDLPKTKYTFLNSDPSVPDYTADAAPDTQFGFNPCRMSNGTYRYLIKPSGANTLSGSYTKADNSKASWTFESSVSGSNYKIYKVDGGSSTIIDKSHTLQAGDFFMKDGSILPGNTVLNATVASKVLGFVFWVGDPTGNDWGDPTLKSAKSCCTHGLVVSLKNVKYGSNASMKWQKSAELVNGWMKGGNSTVNDKGYSEIATTDESKGSRPMNQILGYNNTCVLRAYNTYCDENGKSDNKVLPVVALDAWVAEEENKAPKASSDWYFPSARELSTLCSGWDSNNNITAMHSDASKLSMQENVNGWVKKLNEAGGSAEKLDGNQVYWSSLERSAGIAWGVDFYDAYIYRNNERRYEFLLRPILAF